MSSPGLNILLVEDDDVDVMNVQRAFKQSEITHPVVVAGDGVEALEKLRSGAVPKDRRLVVLDLNLPRMNGLEFLRELRSDPDLTATPVVVLTTSNHEQDKATAYQLHVAGYLLKPVTFDSFREALEVLDRYWTRVELP